MGLCVCMNPELEGTRWAEQFEHSIQLVLAPEVHLIFGHLSKWS